MTRNIAGTVGVASALALALSLVAPAPAEARTITVTLTGERTAGMVGGCSLREAIQTVNSQLQVASCPAPDGLGDTIELLHASYTVRNNVAADTLVINQPVTIRGRGFLSTDITDTGSATLFEINNSWVEVRGITIRDVNAQAFRINAGGSLSLRFSHIVRTGVFNGGGCISNGGYAELTGVELDECNGWTAGGIANTGELWVNSSTIVRSAGARTGAINNSGSAARTYIFSSTLGRNQAQNWGSAVTNSGGVVSISDSTVVYNAGSSATGWALYSSGGTFEITRTLISENTGVTGSPNCSTNIKSLGYNYLGRSSPCVPMAPAPTTDRSGGTLVLESTGTSPPVNDRNLPLSKGGAARVYMPGTGTNNVVDAIPLASCNWTDQRGMFRQAQTTCDIGAAERTGALIVVGSTTLNAADVGLKTALETMGLVVTARDDNSSAPSSYSGYAAVIISDTVSDSTVGTKYRSAAKGVVVNKLSAYDNMSLTATNDFGTVSSSDNSATLLRGMLEFDWRVGDLDEYLISSGTGNWGNPAGGPVYIVATYNLNNRAAIFAFDRRSGMVANRVAFPGTSTAFTGGLTVTGTNLFRESVMYASRQ